MINATTSKCNAENISDILFYTSFVTNVALFIIGCMGFAGALPPSATGWVTLGLASSAFAFNMLSGYLEKPKFMKSVTTLELIPQGFVTAALLTLGSLGGAGILSATQVGGGVVGTLIIGTILVQGVRCFWGLEENRLRRK